MEAKKSPAMTVLSYELKTKMASLIDDVGTKNVELFKEAIKLGLHPTGPQYWLYTWNSRNPEDEFTLKLAIPVTSFGNSVNSENFTFEKIEGIQHVSSIHNGSWENLKDSYGKLMEEMTLKKGTPGMNCREVYINCDFEHPENNITEIQFEILN